jgi:hypothetical protein
VYATRTINPFPASLLNRSSQKGKIVLDRFSLGFPGPLRKGRSGSGTLPGRAPGDSIRRRMTGVMLLRCEQLRNGLRQSGANSGLHLTPATKGAAPMLSVGVNSKDQINNAGFV